MAIAVETASMAVSRVGPSSAVLAAAAVASVADFFDLFLFEESKGYKDKNTLTANSKKKKKISYKS